MTFRGTPELTDESTNTGYAELDDVPSINSPGVALFNGIACSHEEIKYVTFRFVVDIYGDIYYDIY
ncbi:MAG: hypothetical protein Q4F11_07480 [Eubacteriales bacterium]|nr:hypothetical protein [Eubacteriales bacterium]